MFCFVFFAIEPPPPPPPNKPSTILCRNSPPDEAVSPVGGEHNDGGDGALQRPMEIREALDVQHVNLVHKKHTGHQLGDTLVDVAVHHLVDLRSELICKKKQNMRGRLSNISASVEADGDSTANIANL